MRNITEKLKLEMEYQEKKDKLDALKRDKREHNNQYAKLEEQLYETEENLKKEIDKRIKLERYILEEKERKEFENLEKIRQKENEDFEAKLKKDEEDIENKKKDEKKLFEVFYYQF